MYNRAAQYYPTEPTYQRNPDSGNDALQDYQMQLMLLEQQNKKRLLMARREQNSMSYPPPPPSAHPMSTNHLVAPTTASANSSVILEKTKCEDNQSHKEQHLCCICNKAFRRLKHGERHMRTHRPMSERCHVCPVPGCEKSFNRQDNLMEHYKIHLEGWSGSCLTQLTFEGLYGLIRKTKNPDERAMSIETLEKWRNSEHNKQRRDRFLNDSEPDPDSNSLTTDVEEKIEATIHQRQHEGPATASEDKGNHFDNSLGGPSNNPFRQPSFDPFSTFFSHPFNASSGDLFGGLSKDPFRGPSNDPFSGSSNGFVLPIREPITKDSVDLQQASLARQRSMLAQQHSLCMHQQLLAQQRAAQQQQILACQQAMQQQQALQTNMQAQRLAKMQAQATEQ